MNKTLAEIFKQMIPVVFGILIALFINSWKEQYKDEVYIAEIFKSIKIELEESKTSIDENIPKQTRLIDSIRFYMSDDKLSLMEIAVKADGFHAPQIRTNSWQAISRTKIELVNYAKLKVLSDIENSKTLLKEKELYIMNFAYTNVRETSQNVKETFILLLSEIIRTEMDLKVEIENFEKINNQ